MYYLGVLLLPMYYLGAGGLLLKKEETFCQFPSGESEDLTIQERMLRKPLDMEPIYSVSAGSP